MTALVRLLSYFSFLEAAVSESKNETPSLATIIYHILTKTAGENSPFPEREIQNIYMACIPSRLWALPYQTTQSTGLAAAATERNYNDST